MLAKALKEHSYFTDHDYMLINKSLNNGKLIFNNPVQKTKGGMSAIATYVVTVY